MLSTFNGEKYLADQLDSVIAQTYTDWQLLIRDDGSSDKTLEIIENYLKKDARISLINAKNRENIGITASFFELLKYEIADFMYHVSVLMVDRGLTWNEIFDEIENRRK